MPCQHCPTTSGKRNERALACGNGWSKDVRVQNEGLRGWPRLFQLGYEPDVQHREDKNEMKELMEQPEGTQEHSVHKNVLF
jgi:hypothetical protein